MYRNRRLSILAVAALIALLGCGPVHRFNTPAPPVTDKHVVPQGVSGASGCTSPICGEVYDAKPLATNPRLAIPSQLQPLPGARIRILPFGLAILSGKDGTFAFGDLAIKESCAQFDIEVSKAGYGSFVETGMPIHGGSSAQISIFLDASNHNLAYTAGGAAAQAYAACSYPT